MAIENSNIDEKLISLIIEGDECAFTQFYNHYHPIVYGIALNITCSTDLSEEIVQEVFMKIWLKRSDLMSIENIEAYLFVIARNKVFKVLKQIAKNYNTILLQENDNVFAHNNLERRILEKENNLLLHQAIERLPRQQKQVYNLIKDQGLKREEAAEILKLKPETIKFHLAQAMKNIRSYFSFHLDMVAFLFFYIFIQE